MGDMFNNYPQPEDYVPNNRPRHRKEFRLDIMTGETAIHSFEIPFNVEEQCTEFEVIYKLGLKPILIKNSWVLDVTTTECGRSVITCTLSPDETKLFKDTFLEAKVQIKFYMNDGSISFSEIYKVVHKDSLELNRSTPSGGDSNIVYGTNYGWTED